VIALQQPHPVIVVPEDRVVMVVGTTMCTRS
jgi:hypothetical protein